MTDAPAQESSPHHTQVFLAHRAALVAAAYRMLSSIGDAEDVVQEVWLRWARVDLDKVRDPRAYLLRATTRLALNRMREQQRRREDYLGPWLPEPVSTDPADDPSGSVELADQVSMAMLVVLSTLTPLERAAFVLREVFDLPYPEVAETLQRSEASVRQLTHRAREHVAAGAPRRPVDPATHAAVTERFLAATRSGALHTVVQLLAPDAVLLTDGGGQRPAALRPIYGPDKILRFVAGILARYGARVEVDQVTVNGGPAMAFLLDGELDSVAVLQVDGGVVTQVYSIRNPDKLRAVRVQR